MADLDEEIEKINSYIIKCNETGFHKEITVKFIHISESESYKDYTPGPNKYIPNNTYIYFVLSIFSIEKYLIHLWNIIKMKDS